VSVMRSLHLWAAVTACLLPTVARADGWLVAEAPAAIAVSDAQSGVFRPGAMPAVGAYADNGWFALGARLRAGVLRNGPSPGNGFADPGFGGLMTAGLAMRVHTHGAWAELVGAGGLTGEDWVPTVETGVGYMFSVGGYDVGPSARFVRVFSHDSMDAFGSADLALVGIDVSWGRKRTAAPMHASVAKIVAPVVREPVVAVDAVGFAASDGDRVEESREDSCAQRMDGCPIGEHVMMFEDRIVLDERVLFDFAQARVRTGGRSMISVIGKMWRAHPEWRRITVEGHTDVRGSDEYNQSLSERRAQSAREMLEKDGFDASSIDAVGFGRSHPLVEAHDERDHQKNRRVEFVIDREMKVTP
jgi:outer membrane protein OmpA-like peptidoglycan-associated protein